MTLPEKRHENTTTQKDINSILDHLNDLDGELDEMLPLEAGADIRVSGTAVQRGGAGVLLFSGSGSLLAEYATNALATALSAASSGDVVEIPAGTIAADATVPAGVTLRGRGWRSVLQGALTLAAGAHAEHLRVYQSVNTATDLVGVIGPATGTAVLRDVQVALVQAGTGKALGLLSNGGILRGYGCEVWVQGATGGSAWAYAAATGGSVELNQGQAKAWRV